MDTSKELTKMLKGLKMGIYSVNQLLNKADDKNLKKELKDIKQVFKDQMDMLAKDAKKEDESFSTASTTIPTMGKCMIKAKQMIIKTDHQIKREAINVLLMGAYQSQQFIDKHPNLDKTIKKEIERLIQHYYDLIPNFNKK